MSSSSQRGRSSRSAGLLLRVQGPDGHHDEFYLAAGLTIGRSVANTIVLADDESVDRTHARADIDDDGCARLRCVEADPTVTVTGKAVRELPLAEGVRFQVGRTEFECVSGQHRAERSEDTAATTCPFCEATDLVIAAKSMRPCPACKALIISVRLDPDDPPMLLPAFYGKFRARRYIARGGMGLVLKGIREGDTEAVAIKVLLPGTTGERHGSDSVAREVAMLGRVRHPHVVELLDHGKSGRFPFLVLEWIEGPSLRQVIAEANRSGTLTDFATAVLWFEQVANGLAAIHAAGMVHRDIKPSNILIGPDGAARIADLGIAKRIDAEYTTYTRTGHAPGTFEYMAPEQTNAPDTVDGRSDLYSLGLTFYELLTGSRPVGAWSSASEVNPTVPKVFDRILGKLLAPRPERRYRNDYELYSALAGLKLSPELCKRAASGPTLGLPLPSTEHPLSPPSVLQDERSERRRPRPGTEPPLSPPPVSRVPERTPESPKQPEPVSKLPGYLIYLRIYIIIWPTSAVLQWLRSWLESAD